MAGLIAVGVMALRSVRLRRSGIKPWALSGDDDAHGFLRGVFIGLSTGYGVLLVWNAISPGSLRHLLGQAALFTPGWVSWLGLAMMCIGVSCVLWAQHTMGGSWRVGIRHGEHTVLVTTGPFRFSRNPVFLGMLVAALGVAVAIPTAPAWALLSAAYVAISAQVRLEEGYLTQAHGSAYAAYRAAVPRWLSLEAGSHAQHRYSTEQGS